MSKKIISIENLKKIINKSKLKKRKIVLCHGVFDLLHIGHINHFEEAKKFGDILIVSVTTDKYVNKGPGRPAFPEQERLKSLSALKVIDYVVLSKYPTATNIIKELRPNIYCKGQDYKFLKNDTTGEINASRIKAGREVRKVISQPMFQYQTKRNLLQYNTETLPFNLSDSNTAEWADFFPGAKPD